MAPFVLARAKIYCSCSLGTVPEIANSRKPNTIHPKTRSPAPLNGVHMERCLRPEPGSASVTSESSLFTPSGVPLVVREQTAHAPSGAVSVAAVKIVFMLSGWARVRTDADEVTLEAGTVLTIPSRLECWGFPAGHARTTTFYIHPDYLADQTRWLDAAHPLVHHLRLVLDGAPGLQALQLAASAVRELTPSLARLARPPNAAVSDFARLAAVSEVFDAVGHLSGTSSGMAIPTQVVPRREVVSAIALLRAGLSRPWRIAELAQEVAISPSQLARLFRSQVGISPATFLRQLRADRMAELLATTDVTVGEAATAVGWSEAAVASRSFKQRYGVSPRAYARSYRSEAGRPLTLPMPVS